MDTAVRDSMFILDFPSRYEMSASAPTWSSITSVICSTSLALHKVALEEQGCFFRLVHVYRVKRESRASRKKIKAFDVHATLAQYLGDLGELARLVLHLYNEYFRLEHLVVVRGKEPRRLFFVLHADVYHRLSALHLGRKRLDVYLRLAQYEGYVCKHADLVICHYVNLSHFPPPKV